MIEEILLENLGTIIISAVTLIGFIFVTKYRLSQLDPLAKEFQDMSIIIVGLKASFEEFKGHVEKDLDSIRTDIREIRKRS